MRKKILIFGFVCGVLNLGLILPAAAQESSQEAILTTNSTATFKSDLQAAFVFNELESAKATLDFRLTNTTPTQFVSQYQFAIPGENLPGLVVLPKEQKITKEQRQETSQTVLTLTFDNDVVGQGKAREFGVEFSATPYLVQRGLTRVITIPALSGSDTFTSYQTLVTVPTAWGNPNQMTMAMKQAPATGLMTYTFDQSSGQDIYLIFGEAQYLAFTYQGELINTSNAPTYQEFEFPGDLPGISWYYTQLEPQPERWRRGDSGTWYGYYLLDTGKSLTVTTAGYLTYYQVNADFVASQFYPDLPFNLTTWNVEVLPEELQFWLAGSSEAGSGAAIALSAQVKRAGPVPLFNNLEVVLTNLTGLTVTDLTLHNFLTTPTAVITPERLDGLTLLPWEKQVIIVQVHPDSWLIPYLAYVLQMNLSRYDHNLITQEISSLAVSYWLFATVGGVVALALTAGSLLVARRKKQNSLRR